LIAATGSVSLHLISCHRAFHSRRLGQTNEEISFDWPHKYENVIDGTHKTYVWDKICVE
jgi:hypothetical protein